MIIERLTFHLKFGKAKESIAIWKEVLGVCQTRKACPPMRLLTDLTGTSYTLVVEMNHRSLLDFGPNQYIWLVDERLRELYQKFIPLCENAERTLFKIEQEV